MHDEVVGLEVNATGAGLASVIVRKDLSTVEAQLTAADADRASTTRTTGIEHG
jgi:hypothetical protein